MPANCSDLYSVIGRKIMTKHAYQTADLLPVIGGENEPLASADFFRFERLEGGVRSGHGMDRSAHRHTFCELFLFESGSGHHEIDFERYPIHAGSLHWVQANQLHYLVRDAACSGWVIGFSAGLFADAGDGAWFAGLRLNQLGTTHPAVITASEGFELEIRQQFEAIGRGKETGQNKSLQYARLRLLLLLTQAAGSSIIPDPAAMPSLNQARYQQFMALVDRHYLHEQNISFYSQTLNCSPEQLRESCRKLTGKSPQELLHQRRLLEAKRLLLHSSVAVKEIAFALGFVDPAYFGRFFRRLSGRSPEQFRLEIREKYQ